MGIAVVIIPYILVSYRDNTIYQLLLSLHVINSIEIAR